VKTSLRGRFFAHVRRSPTCWIWTGATDPDGYGVMADGPKTRGAHRVSYELHHRQIPPGALIMHSCDVPACVNPAHLCVGTKRTNALDMTMKGRRASKLNGAKVAAIRARAEAGETAEDLGRCFGVHATTIRNIVKRRSWK
jgi:predicted NBD/HSP70 family sugar kinase